MEGRTNSPGSDKVRPWLECQLGWLTRRRGVGVGGTALYFLLAVVYLPFDQK